MTESCEISFAVEPREVRNEGNISKPGDVTSREGLAKVAYKPGKSKSLSRSLHLEHTYTSTCTQTERLRSRIKSLTPTDLLHTPVREARPRKLSAPELGMAEKHNEGQIQMYTNNFHMLDSQQGTKHLITGPHLYFGDRCCYCQYRHEREESVLELDEFWLQRRDSREELPSANSAIFILKGTKYQSARRRSVMCLADDEPVCGKSNTNTKTKRRHSKSSTRSTSKMPGYRRSRQSLRRKSQLPDGQTTAVTINRQMSTTSDTSGGSSAVAVSSKRRVSADPESGRAYEDMAHNVVDVSDKRRRLIVSLFTAFVIMLVAVAIIMISATLSIGAGGIGST
jgi:hypothetical protein